MKFKFYLKKSHFGWKLTVRSNLALNKAYYIDHISVLVLNTMMESTLEHTAQQLLLETLYKANRGSHEWGDDQMVQFGYSRIRALRMKIHPEYVITISAYIKCIIHVGVTVSSSWFMEKLNEAKQMVADWDVLIEGQNRKITRQWHESEKLYFFWWVSNFLWRVLSVLAFLRKGGPKLRFIYC